MDTESKNMAEWYFKAENVVVSSMTLGQLETARNYIEMYLQETKDKSGYDVLLRKHAELAKNMAIEP